MPLGTIRTSIACSFQNCHTSLRHISGAGLRSVEIPQSVYLWGMLRQVAQSRLSWWRRFWNYMKLCGEQTKTVLTSQSHTSGIQGSGKAVSALFFKLFSVTASAICHSVFGLWHNWNKCYKSGVELIDVVKLDTMVQHKAEPPCLEDSMWSRQ